MSRLKALLFVCLMALVLLGIRKFLQTPKEITAAQARQLVAAGAFDHVVDVRTDAEWKEGHLVDTVSIPIGDFVTALPARIPNKDARILFVCKKGIRASAVVTMAEKLGYSNTQAMMGNWADLQTA
jgi:phage shock protein E